ncbi:MAG: choice-of-anchor B family protein [Bacteroidetes bacterium]|nr:choice-of-anchor B family protein [Bacteroidota bacterium]
MKKILLASLFCILNSVLLFSQNLNVTLASTYTYSTGTIANICGWKSPVDGKEYALVGAHTGLSIVDVSNPSVPSEIVLINGPSCLWREIKTYGNYAYVTSECGNIGLQIVDLTNLPATNLTTATWTPTINTTTLATIHALHIDTAKGKVYLYGSNVGNQGAIIADIKTNPMAPVYKGSYDNRYIHDGYVRNDTLYACHIYDGDCEMVDVTNPVSGVSIGDVQTPGLFTHNSWLNANSKVVFTTDEVSDSYLTSYDISNPSNIFELDRIQSNPGSNSDVHNTHIIQKSGAEYAVTSWYNDGFTIVDVTRPDNMVQVGNYDTEPTVSGSGEDHDWGVYPFLPSGIIVASDMENGLFVCAPTYIRACYLEGTVTDCNTNAPLNNVNVTIQVTNPQSNSNTDVTDFAGKYAEGVPLAGTYQVIFSRTGYITDTDTVVLSNGVVTLDNFTLCPLPVFAYSGKIFDNSTSVGIPSAFVSVYDANSRWDTITDANGNFTIPTMFNGNYSVASGKWGYKTNCTAPQAITSTSAPFSMGLNKEIYDDFMWDYNWTISGNIVKGIWERAVPVGFYNSQGAPVNPSADVTNDCGDVCYANGNHGITGLDMGSTLLTSPVFDLSAYTNPYLYYSRWKYLPWNTNTDTVVITLSNGTNTATLEKLTYISPGNGQWVNKNYKISSLLSPTSSMSFTVRVTNNSGKDIIGALDRFFIVDSANSAVNEPTMNEEVNVFPNPSADGKFTVQSSGFNVEGIEIDNIFGEKVTRSVIPNAVRNLTIDLSNQPNGIYFIKLTTDRGIINKKIILNK